MKKFVRIALILLAFALAASCAEQPVQEIDSAKAAVTALKAAGADKYAPEIGASVDRDLAAAIAEIKTQDGKFIKNYDNAKSMLAGVKGNAEKVMADVEARKQQLLEAANASKAAAEAAVTEASSLVAKAPAGKGTQEDIEALKADIKGLEELLPSVQGMINAGDYSEASTKAASITNSAATVSGQVREAIQKYEEGRKKKGARK